MMCGWISWFTGCLAGQLIHLGLLACLSILSLLCLLVVCLLSVSICLSCLATCWSTFSPVLVSFAGALPTPVHLVWLLVIPVCWFLSVYCLYVAVFSSYLLINSLTSFSACCLYVSQSFNQSVPTLTSLSSCLLSVCLSQSVISLSPTLTSLSSCFLSISLSGVCLPCVCMSQSVKLSPVLSFCLLYVSVSQSLVCPTVTSLFSCFLCICLSGVCLPRVWLHLHDLSTSLM